ncbi:MAG: hypothetical protein ACPG31_11485 [Planctomycetota bacterium]
MTRVTLLVGLIGLIGAFVLLFVGSFYNAFVFQPDYHDSWWEALFGGDWGSLLAFVKSTPGKITYGGGCLLLFLSIVSFALLWFSLPDGELEEDEDDEEDDEDDDDDDDDDENLYF